MREARARLRPRPVPWDGPAYAPGLIEHSRQLASPKHKPADWPLKRIQIFFVLELALRQTYGLTLGEGFELDDPIGLMACTLIRLRDPTENKDCDYSRTLLRKNPDGGWPLVAVDTMLGGFLHDTCYLIARAGLAEPLLTA